MLASVVDASQSTARVPSQLKSVLVRPTDGSVRVIFRLTRPVSYKSTRTANPSRIVIDLLQAGISPVFTKREILSVHTALIRVLISRARGSTRAVLDLGSAGTFTVYAADDELIVEIKTSVPAMNARSAPAPLVGTPLPAAGVIAPELAPQTREFHASASDASVTIPWVPLGPNVGDFISRNSYPTAAHVSNFRQREPGDGNAVSEDTSAYLCYDNEYLYAAFVCRDESGDVRKHLAARDTIADDDQVALYLDTFHDGRHAYVFASNPFGVQQDGIISDGDDASCTADMLWRSEGRLTPDGFVVLMAIPFKTLRFSADSVQNWRFAVGRTIARPSESAYFPHISRRVNGFVRQMAALDGLELISPGCNVQMTPYGAFARARSFDEGTRAQTRYAGVDAKVVVKNAVTVDAAVNPEFSEIDPDDPLITVNQRFELFRSYSWGSAINYTPAAGLAPFLGSKQDAYASVTLRPSARVAIQAIELHEGFQTIPGVSSPRSQSVFSTNLLRAKANLQITRSLALRGIVDYDQLDSDPALFSDSKYGRLMGDALITFVLHPGTAVYAGFNNRYENLILEPGANRAIDHAGLPRFPIGQQIFVKMSYLFRF